MAKKEISLKGLSHVSSTDKKTVLKHKNGAFVTIHHPALSPESQTALAALKGQAADASTPIQADEMKHDAAKMMAEGGQVGMEAIKKEKYDDTPRAAYAEGGDVETPAPQTNSTERTKPAETGKCVVIRPNTGYGAIIRCGMAEGGEVHIPDMKHEPKHCMHCGGKLAMAHGGGVPPEGDANPQPTTDFKPEIADEVNRLPVTIGEDITRDVLNTPAKMMDFTPDKAQEQPLSAAENEINNVSRQGARNDMSMALPAGMTPEQMGVDLDYPQITKHGEIPADIPNNVISKASNRLAWEKEDKQKEVDKTAADAAERSKLLGGMGLQDPNAASVTPASVAQGAAPQPNGTTTNTGAGLPNPMDAEGMLREGIRQQKQGIQDSADAQGKLGEAQATSMQANTEAMQHAQSEYQHHYQDLEQERQAFQQDIRDGQVDPNKYWTGDKDGNGGHSKIMAGIGMILAGFNPTTNPNAAIGFLKHQMEMNIQAQARNLGSKESMLSANLRQFGNLKDAMDMTRIMQHDMLANELGAAAAKAQSPLAKSAAMQAMGKLNMDTAPMIQQFAMRRAMMNMANGGGGSPQAIDHMLGYMRVMNPEMAKEMESRYVPGIGLASIPVPQDVRKELAVHDTLDSIGRDLLDYSKNHTNLIPGTPEYNVGVQKAQILQQHVREGLLGTVFRDSERPLLQQFVDSNPAGAFKMLSTQPKLRTLLESNTMQGNVVRKQYGLPAKEAPVDTTPKMGKNGKMYVEKMVGGKKYMVPAQ